MGLEGIDQSTDSLLVHTSNQSKRELLDAVPIFVVGMTRSGTKWLSNLLAAHPDVAAVQNERHRGILETSIFDTTPRKFDLSEDDDFAAFIELWSHSDFFHAAGADKELFYQLPASSRDYISLFSRLMNDMACRRGCQFWLQKISPHSAVPVLKRFPKARVVIIKRKLIDVIRSQAALNVAQGRSRGVASTAYDYAFQEKHALRIRRMFPSAACLSYEQLKDDTDATIKRVCDMLGLDTSTHPLRSTFAPNTSFPRGQVSLPWIVEMAALTYATMLRALPLWMLIALSTARRTLRRKKQPDSFHSGEFGLLKDRLAIRPHKDLH